jgi:hypothetical protein
MNNVTKQFQLRLAAFREMPDKRRHVVCEAMRISQKTHLRLLAEIRKETGTLTKQERFREIVGRVRDWIGDGDARAMSLALASRALSISTSQAGRARDVIVRDRMDATEAPRLKLVANPPLPPTPKRRKVDWLFTVEGDRLFSMNREPAEVGA